jgi:hypothetical protein
MLFEDETGFSLHPKLGRVWERREQRPLSTPKASTKSASIFLAGSILFMAPTEL